jgi:hypothetical protein
MWALAVGGKPRLNFSRDAVEETCTPLLCQNPVAVYDRRQVPVACPTAARVS